MKKRKLVLALMLSLMMLVTMIPSFSFADETGGTGSSAGSGAISAATSGTCGATGHESDVTWRLKQNNSDAANPTYTLTIDGSGAMADYKAPVGKNINIAEAAPWYQTLSADATTKLFPITNIEIGDKVTGLGDYAFAYTGITAIGFHKNVTDYGDNLYSHCSKVEVVDWAGFNPKNIRDGYVTEQTATGSFIPFSMFDYCENLNQCKNGATTYPAGKLVFPENITGVMTAAFRGTGFSSIDFESSNLTRAGAYVFSYMPNLTELTVPGKVEFYQQNGDLQSSAFQGCAALEKVTLDDSVTIIPYRMFSQCSKLAEVQADKADSKLETIDRNAFAQCGKLASFTFPDALKNLRNSAFIQTGLTSVELGAVETLDNNVFQGCASLKTVSIEGTKDLKLPGSLFNGSWNNSTHGFDNDGAKLTSFTVENGDLSDFSLSGSKTTLKNVVLGDGVTNVPNGLLSGFEVLETVSLGKGVTSIADNTFKECTSLKSIELSEGLTSIGNHAFNGCTSLAAVHLEKATALKTLGRSAFEGCTALTEIEIPDAVTEIGNNAFCKCSKLIKVDISPNSKLTTIGGGAFVNSEVPYFYIPSGVTVGQQAFFFNAEPTNKKITYDLSGWDTKNLNTSVFGKWCFSQHWNGTNYQEITRTFYLPDDTVVPYLPIGTSSIYTNADSSDTADRTRNAVYAVTNGGTFAKNTDFTTDTLATPIKKNHKFLGWYDNKGCDGTAVSTAPTAGKTYYAKWGEKNPSTIALKNNLKLDRTYTDPAVALSKDSCNITGSRGDITFVYEQKDGDQWIKVDGVPTNAGTYRVKAMLDEDADNASAESKYVEFTINKATPKYDAPNGLEAIEGQTLADVKLPKGFAWDKDAATSVGSAGDQEFTVTYTPDDTDNFEVVKEIKVTIKVHMKWVALNEVPVINAEDKTLTVGDNFDPKSGVTATDKEDGDLTDQIEIVKNTVDTSKAGLYSVTYEVTDKDGASVEKSINVVVKEKTAPPTTVSQDGSANGTKTGDAMPIGMLAVLMLAAAAGIVFCGRKLYKSR